MAHISIRSLEELDSGLVLAPERYDPRRRHSLLSGNDRSGRRIADCALLVRETLSPNKADVNAKYLVLDTGDAQYGFAASGAKEIVKASAIGSTKKVFRAGDVIVSRLRPYLRQIAWLDVQLFDCPGPENLRVLGSTEFYVLRPNDGRSVAFLVPYLLSDDVQRILSASQEGGHHPRFPEKALLDLVVPEKILKEREELSAKVELAITAARRSQSELRAAIRYCEDPLLA